MMIEANIRTLSRVELLYACISKFAIYVHKQDRDDLLTGLEEYYGPNNFNRIFYYSNNEETVDRLPKILQDADLLLSTCGDLFEDTQVYQNLMRCLSEQTIRKDGVRRLRTREDGGMSSSILHPPEPFGS